MSESMGHMLFSLMISMRREIERAWRDTGLTDAQWKPLWMLKLGRADTAFELAREMSIDAGAMTRMLDRLEAKGLIERVRSETDRRVVHLRLTPDGEAAANTVPHVLASVNNDYLRGFSKQEWAQLKEYLQRMLVNGQALQEPKEEQNEPHAHCLRHRFAARTLPSGEDARRRRGAVRPPRSLPATWLTAATMVGAVLATAVLLAGCASPAGVAPPSHALMTPAQAGAAAVAHAWPETDWWTAWGDPQLDALVDAGTASAAEPADRAGAARQAQAAVDVAGAARAPQVNGSRRPDRPALHEERPGAAAAGRRNALEQQREINASWELDLFGRQRAALDSAIGQLRATQADAQAARVLLPATSPPAT